MDQMKYPEQVKRTLLQRFGDRIFPKKQEAGGPTNSYTIMKHMSVPMRDGVKLLADVYTPISPIRR
jgi:predicted acyl esterase